MLKISFSETPSEEKWILQGRLTAPWLRELNACWKKNHRKDKQRACIVDLNEITFIDKSGERLLRVLVREGAQCIATGVYIKHVLEQLNTKAKGSFLNRLSGFFMAAVVAAFTVRFGAECIATELTIKGNGLVLSRLTGFFFAAVLAVAAVLIGATTTNAQNTVVTGSVPSGPASDQVLRLTLRDTINLALRSNESAAIVASAK